MYWFQLCCVLRFLYVYAFISFSLLYLLRITFPETDLRVDQQEGGEVCPEGPLHLMA